MKKIYIYRIVSVLLIIGVISLSCFSIKLKKENEDAERLIATNNYNEWYYLRCMSEAVDKRVTNPPESKQRDNLVDYINSNIYRANITPPFDGGDYTGFLRTHYDGLYRDLMSEGLYVNLPDELYDEGFKLFAAMNTDLYNICKLASNKENSTNEKKQELLDEKSKLNIQITEQIHEYIKKYAKPVEALWEKMEKYLAVN